MLTSSTQTSPYHSANDQWTTGFTAKHVAQLGTLVKDHDPTDAEEIDKHEFGYRTQAGSSCTDGRSNKASFGDRCIKDTSTSKLLHQAFGDTKHTTPGIITLKLLHTGTTGDILTHQNNSWITAH